MKVKYIIRTIALLLIIVALVAFIGQIVQVNNGRDVAGMYGLDFEEENSIDVALIGPSQIYASYYAPLAYKEYGYTSYPIATSAMSGSLYKYAVKQMRERQNPKVYIIELSGFYYEVQTSQPVLRKYLDNIPTYSPSRLEAINTLVPSKDRMSFYIPFIKYHNNLANIKTCFKVYKDKINITKRGYSLFKNFSTTDNVYDCSKTNIARKTRSDITDEAIAYLDDLLKYLNENNIENVVFCSFPDEFNRYKTDSFNKAISMIEDAGYIYEDFYTNRNELIGLNPRTDYYNVGHLNILGAEKMTRFIGEYVTTNYDLDTNYSKTTVERWNDCASKVDEVVSLAKQRLQEGGDSDGHQVFLESEFFYKPDTWKKEGNKGKVFEPNKVK